MRQHRSVGLIALVALLGASSCRSDEDEAVLQAAPQPLIRQAALCLGCDPACNVVADAPRAHDLTDENSIGVRYDEGAEGLVLDGGETGRYRRRIDGRIPCARPLAPMWEMIAVDADLVDGSELTFSVQTADRAVDLDGASPVVIEANAGESTYGLELDAHGAGHRRYLQVSAELTAAPDGASPVFRTLQTLFYCVCGCDAERDACTPGCPCDSDC